MDFRVIPAIDVLEGKVVRLLRGDYKKVTVYGVDPVRIAERIKELGYDWIHLVNLDGARKGEVKDVVNLVERIKKVGLCVEVGGGIRKKADVERLINAGADRVIIGTMAFKDKSFLSWALTEIGRERVVVGMDVKKESVLIQGWTSSSNFDLDSAIEYLHELGVEWILCTDIDRDGTQVGPNVDLYRYLCEKFSGRILASGGVGSWEDIDKLKSLAGKLKNLSGLVVGRFFYESGILKINGQ